MACPILWARNNIQPINIRIKVTAIWRNSLKVGNRLFSATVFKYFRFYPLRSSGKNSNPLKAPHETKVQLAPCQNPLTTNTINVFRMLFHFPPLLPPNGIYT